VGERSRVATLRRAATDPAKIAVALALKAQRDEIARMLDEAADALLARGNSLLAVASFRDAGDMVAGRLPWPCDKPARSPEEA
jgi:hypothetical protein